LTMPLKKDQYKPEVRILAYLDEAPQLIASAGKSTLTAKAVSDILDNMDSSELRGWIVELVRRGHGSPLEHSLYVFEIVCSRVASHQLVRHRHASYTQLSQRYSDGYLKRLVKRAAEYLSLADLHLSVKPSSRSDYERYADILKKFLEAKPSYISLLEAVAEAYIIPPTAVRAGDRSFLEHLIESTAEYYSALARGFSPEDARFLIPQAVKTRLVVSMNARELVEVFLPLRMCVRAQWEIRYIAWSMWRALAEVHPEIFAYAGPRCVYMDNRVRAKPCTLLEYLEGKCDFEINRCPELVSRTSIPACLKNASVDPWIS